MKGDFDWGNLVHWARDDLGLPLDADYCIPDEQARELLAQIAETGKMEKPLMELVAAYGNQIRRILGAHVKDAGDMENAENEFWTTVVQNAGKYVKARPVKRWLSVIAKHQAIAAYRRLHQRMNRVLFRAEMAAKMRDDGGQDDLDLESLADKNAVAEKRELTPDEVLEQEELAKEAHRVVESFLGSLDAETRDVVVRNKVDRITFKAWAKRTGKSGKARLRLRGSRAYRKMRQKVSPDLRRSLVHVYREAIWNMRRSKQGSRRRIYAVHGSGSGVSGLFWSSESLSLRF